MDDQSQPQPLMRATDGAPRWSLCIATYNREQILLHCVRCALAQTLRPAEIVIVDATDDWMATREAVAALCADAPEVQLRYMPAEARSSAFQRNQAIGAAEGDVLFLIDDDSLMHPDCAERIMALYERDTEAVVAGVSPANVPQNPIGPDVGVDRKESGRRGGPSLMQRATRTRIGRWINARVLMQQKEELFLPYEEGRVEASTPPWADEAGAVRIGFLPGHSCTVRRAVALKEPFETSLRFYTAFEDLDASYRYRRHGVLLRLPAARLHHFEAASGRVSRAAATALQLLNMLVFIRRRAADPEAMMGRYQRMLARRLLGETLKDALSGRWEMPQARGVLMAMQRWRAVRGIPVDQLDAWYPEFQAALIAAAPPPAKSV